MKAGIHIIKSLIRSRFPDIFKVLSKYYWGIKRVKARIIWRLSKKEISGEILANQLRLNAMINAGDILMVHSSLSAIGKVIGGGGAVIHALQNVLTEDGTLMMPSYHQPEPVLKMIKDGKVVDLRTAQSTVGKLAETFRTLPGVFRSSHPFSSVSAWGRYASEITAGHANSPLMCGPGSPLFELVERSGKIMGIGVSIAWISIYHALEDNWKEFPIDVHYPESFIIPYIDMNGQKIEREIIVLNPIVSLTRIEKNRWILDWLTNHMRNQRILHEFMLGQAPSWIVNARLFYEELKSLALKGVTIYTIEEEFDRIGYYRKISHLHHHEDLRSFIE